jgi:uncharacterized protein (TIGR02145 family)
LAKYSNNIVVSPVHKLPSVVLPEGTSYLTHSINVQTFHPETIRPSFSGHRISTTSLLYIPLQSPVALVPTNRSYNSFTANWEPVANVVTYSLHYAVNTGSQSEPVWGTYIEINVGNVTSYNLTGLLGAEEYLYHVHASNSEYVTEASNSIWTQTLQWLGEGVLYNGYAVNRETGIAMYDWYAASKNGGTGVGSLAPTGWHIPTVTEWNTLITTSGGTHALRETGTTNWASPNTGATNTSGFTAVPGGIYPEMYGLYDTAEYWTSSANGSDAFEIYISPSNVSASSIGSKHLCMAMRIIKDDSTDPGTVTDYDGNVYNTVKIGDQVWTTSDLAVKHYNNGTDILLRRNTAPGTNGSMYWYMGLTGGLEHPGPNGVGGWYVPTADDFTALKNYLGGYTVAGGHLTSASQSYWNGDIHSDNSSGFNAKGGGNRNYQTGNYQQLLSYVGYWTTSEFSQEAGSYWVQQFGAWTTETFATWTPSVGGEHVRLIRDALDDINPPTDGTTGTFTDRDGNVYPTIAIGGRRWMTTDLKVLTYNDARSVGSLYSGTNTVIPIVEDATEWHNLTTGAGSWCSNTLHN